MLDNANLIEEYERALWKMIQEMHKANIKYEVIHFILSEMVKTLEIQGYAENWLNQL